CVGGLAKRRWLLPNVRPASARCLSPRCPASGRLSSPASGSRRTPPPPPLQVSARTRSWFGREETPGSLPRTCVLCPCASDLLSTFYAGWRMGYSATPEFHRSRLELAVHVDQQGLDGRSHGLVANEHHNRDCGEDQRVFRHRLTSRELIALHIQFPDHIHFPCPPVLFFAEIGIV